MSFCPNKIFSNFSFSISRAEKLWCTFVLWTKRAPNIDWTGTKYRAINGSQMTITTAKLMLCTNYTPDLCNVFCNLLGNKQKNDFNYSEKEQNECFIILSRHGKILFP